MMKIKLRLMVVLFSLVFIGLFSGPIHSMYSSGASSEATDDGISYLYGSFKEWEENKTLVTSVGVYKIVPGVSLIDKVGTRAGKRDTTDGIPINVRLQFLDKKLKQVVIY